MLIKKLTKLLMLRNHDIYKVFNDLLKMTAVKQRKDLNLCLNFSPNCKFIGENELNKVPRASSTTMNKFLMFLILKNKENLNAQEITHPILFPVRLQVKSAFGMEIATRKQKQLKLNKPKQIQAKDDDKTDKDPKKEEGLKPEPKSEKKSEKDMKNVFLRKHFRIDNNQAKSK